MSDDKPLELWIEPLDGIEARLHVDTRNIRYKAPEQIIHVIEKSAYDGVVDKYLNTALKLNEAADRIIQLQVTCGDLTDRVDRLKARNARLVEALKSCKAAMDYAYEDHSDQYYLNVKEQISKAPEENE